MGYSVVNTGRDTKTLNSNGETSVNVVADISGQPIEVTFSTSKVADYAESNSVAGLATMTILTYVVPVGKKVLLNNVLASGTNKAEYIVDLNGSTISLKRSYFTEFNVDFLGLDVNLVAGDTLKIIVENKRNSVADFNANFSGEISDA